MRRRRAARRPRLVRDADEGMRSELDRELEFHFQRTIEDLVREGQTRETAEQEARRRFGDETRYRLELMKIDRRHTARRRNAAFLNGIYQTLLHGVRSIRRTPVVTVAIVLTFGLGIGANATMFGFVDRLLLRPPMHIGNHDQVRRLYVNGTILGSRMTVEWISLPDYHDFLSSRTLASLAAYSPEEMTLGAGEGAIPVRATIATASLFPLLQVRPALGRFFTTAEDQLGASGVVVLGHAFWQQRFGGDANVLGRPLQIGNGSYTVIGVAPEGFSGVELAPVDVWLPLYVAADHIYDTDRWRFSRDWWFFKSVARLKDDIETASAEAELTAIYRQSRAERDDYDPSSSFTLASLIAARTPTARGEIAVTRWLAGVSMVVLLIACANVMNLLLARGIRWRREFAIRISLGISRARMIGQLLTEGVMVAVLGGAVALMVAAWGADLVRKTLVPDVLWPESPVNVRVFLFTILISVVAGAIASLAPVVQSARQDPGSALKENQKGLGVTRSRLQTALLLTQTALAVVLLVGAGLFVRSLQRLQSLDHGITVENVLVAGLEFNTRDLGPEDSVNAYAQAVDDLRRIPGVVQATAVSVIPFQNTRGVQLRIPGLDSLPVPPHALHGHSVTPGYFETLEAVIVRGRGFETADAQHSQRVAVVNETMARILWPNDDAIGKCLLIGPGEPPCAEVVGVAKDVREREATADPGPQFYGLMGQGVLVGPPRAILVRYTPEARGLAETVRRTILRNGSDVRAVNTMLLSDLLDPQLRSWNLGATMFSVFGCLALVVAAVGLYSILAFDIESRTHELGIRSALGASGGKLVTIVLRQAVGLTVLAVIVGSCLSFALGQAIESLLFQVSPRDPLVFATVTITLLAVAVIAAWMPATRAAKSDPIQVLRME